MVKKEGIIDLKYSNFQTNIASDTGPAVEVTDILPGVCRALSLVIWKENPKENPHTENNACCL